MRLGCCISTFARENDPMGLWTLPILKEAGYSYAELHTTAFTKLSEEDFAALEERVRQSSVPAETANCLFPGELSLYGEAAPIFSWLEKAFERACRLGVKVLVFGSGRSRAVPAGFDRGQAEALLVKRLRRAGEMAGERGLMLAAEPLNREETNLLLNLDEGAELIQKINCPSLRLLVDYYHYDKENDSLSGQALALLAHSHYADPAGRSYPKTLDEGSRAFLKALQEGGYDGRISIEASADSEDDLWQFPKAMAEAGFAGKAGSL